MKKILIIGINGFIGSYLRDHFLKKGYHVLGTTSSHRRIEEAVDYVIHCASQQPRSHLSFHDYYQGNIGSLIETLDWMKTKEVKRIISFSSATVYADRGGDILFEESYVDPLNDYAISKFVADQILKVRTAHDGLSSFCFRMPSVFGPAQIGGLVHTYYTYAKKNTDFDIFSQGQLKRNLLHVEEVAQACERGIENFGHKHGFNLYLLGSANSLTMKEIAHNIAEYLESRSNINLSKENAPVEINWVFCLDKIKKELGFIPLSIEDGLKRYIQEMEGKDV